ncbi:endonuclease domain-containing protein [Lonepinella sp. BR2357]|uniref:endonuclease domain-containing protein n=1 Tax=Lonepinella sp. BR2357 TaxID=3434549 RepID=UPI003F6DD54E
MNTFTNKILLEFSRELRKRDTEEEHKLWQHLRNRLFCGLKFYRQRVIEPYIVDFICYEKNLIIELDGSQHYEDKQMQYDKERTLYLNELGFIVLRFDNNEINRQIDNVLETIYLCINGEYMPEI